MAERYHVSFSTRKVAENIYFKPCVNCPNKKRKFHSDGQNSYNINKANIHSLPQTTEHKLRPRHLVLEMKC